MAAPNALRTLSTQTLMFDEINWNQASDDAPAGQPVAGPPVTISGKPAGARSGMSADPRPPYWEFTYQLDHTSGLTFTNVVVRDTQSAGSTEDVFDRIEFTDFEVTFNDGTMANVDLTRAFANPASRFEIHTQGGTRHTVSPNDDLYQRGVKLTLVDNVLAGSGGTCTVTMELSLVLRGAANDFDPGGVPVAMLVFPQIGYTWSSSGATKQVAQFRGSVKLTLKVKMYPSMNMTAPNENVASFFADSNTAMTDNNRKFNISNDVKSWFGSFKGLPWGWAMIFDYVLLDLHNEREIVAVYGPKDGNFYHNTTWGSRNRMYVWPPQILGPYRGINLDKADRQGYYDNVHIHAKMPDLDTCHNVQVHAPFCGHSCLHTHWRWTSISSNSALDKRGWQYRGWSNPPFGLPPVAHTQDDAPLIPPNQRLVVALCRRGATRFSPFNIVNPIIPLSLDPLYKMLWYCADIFDPAAGQRQVIYEHGSGWAYRYATPGESSSVNGLEHAIVGDNLPWFGTPTQAQLMTFFESYVYPTFRYLDTLLDPCKNQVPDGTYDEDVTQKDLFGSLPRIQMERL